MARIAVDGFLSPFNLGNPTETTILELAKKIISINIALFIDLFIATEIKERSRY